ncbi:hypothetical protein [Halomonas sp. BC04]|uniref:hypothetical protein n=1 Tax=Halomonas sp. BC04 TaxID=1403540 RepID=UPI002F35E287
MHQGDRFSNLYAVRTGSLKQVQVQGDARDQVTHFYLPVSWWAWTVSVVGSVPAMWWHWSRHTSASCRSCSSKR